jgi:hypothetical protein
VAVSAWDKFWRRFSTKTERSKQRLFIPTEFTGLDIDADGFVFASNFDGSGKQAVRRLNPKGQDVIKKGENENIGGDINVVAGVGTYTGVSRICDVVVRDGGIYSMLDMRRGRVFTYDHEGNLLYIFGGLGSQAGTFTVPVAIESIVNRILVLDSNRKEIHVFNETAYGSLINDAIRLRFDGDETLAVQKWGQVLDFDMSNELANTGIGKAYLASGNNKLAMKYLKLGMNRQYYSIAFKRYRNDILKEYLNVILSGALIVVAGVVIFIQVRKRRRHLFADEDGAFDV